MRSPSSRALLSALLAPLAAFAPAARARQPADPPAQPEQPVVNEALNDALQVPSPLRFDLSLYLWAPNLDGDVTVRGSSASVDADFVDVVKESDSVFGLSGRLGARYERFGAFVDATYMRLGVDDISSGNAVVDLTSELLFVDFGLSWRLVDEPLEAPAPGRDDARAVRLEVYAGGRHTDMEVTLDPQNVAARSRDRDWIDPIVGAALEFDATESLRLLVRGDVGGFGVGSDFTWSALAAIGFDFEMFDLPSTVYLGYRALGQDYTDGSGDSRFEWDMILHGPIVALTIRF